MAGTPDEALPLRTWVDRIAGDGPLDGIGGARRRKLLLPCIALLKLPDLKPATLREITDWNQLLALRAAVALRGRQVLEVWQPLLRACRDGSTTAPIKDLKRTAAEARAIGEALAQAKDGGDKAAGLERLEALAKRLDGWLPAPGARSRYERFEGLTYRGERTAGKLAEERLRGVNTTNMLALGAGVAVLVLAAGALFVHFGISSLLPESVTPQLQLYQAALPEVVGAERDGEALVVTVRPSWSEAGRGARLRGLMALHESALATGWERIELRDPLGHPLATVQRTGEVQLADE